MLQRFDGVGARRHHVVENGQLVAQFVEVGCGLALIAIKAHALAVGGLANHQHQGSRLAGLVILEVGQRRDLADAGEHALHVVQLLQVAAIGNHHLPRHCRLDPALKAFQGGGQVVVLDRLLDQRVADNRDKDGHGCGPGLHAGQIHRAQAGPQEHGKSGMRQEGQHHPPGKVLGHVFASFRDVRFEHDEDDALREFLLIDKEVAQAGHRARPQHDANDRGHCAGLLGEHQHRGQPDGAHHKGLAKA